MENATALTLIMFIPICQYRRYSVITSIIVRYCYHFRINLEYDLAHVRYLSSIISAKISYKIFISIYAVIYGNKNDNHHDDHDHEMIINDHK